MSLLWVTAAQQVPTVLWHGAGSTNRAAIQQHGLDPTKTQAGEVPHTWFFSDRSRLGPHSDVWEYHRPPEHEVEHGSAWSFEWHPDDPVWVAAHHIGPEHLRLVQEGR